MKRYFVLLIVTMFLFAGCSKDDDPAPPAVVVPGVTQVTGTATFQAGSSGDLSNAKISIYTSLANWNTNTPVKFGVVSGSGASVTFVLAGLNPGNYYLDVWKDNDNNAVWSTGDFVGWYGSGGLGSPNLTEFQIADEETKTFTISMQIR